MSSFQANRFKVRLYQIALKLANKIQTLPTQLTPPPFRLLQMSSAFWQSRALYVATRLQIAETLAENSLTTEDLAKQLNLHEDHLYRLLRMLAAFGIFQETTARSFTNSKTSHYLRADHPQSIRAMILLHNSPEMSVPWFEALEDSLRTGKIPFKQQYGADLFAYLDTHPDFAQLFANAMSSVEHLTGTAFLQDFNWSAFSHLIDIGGSTGHKTLSILQAHPQLTALVFDRPQVIAQANWQGIFPAEVLARMSLQGGDMFTSLPPAETDQDLYVFFAIFHALSEAQSQQVLANLKIACAQHRPWVLIGEVVAAESQLDSTIASFDMQMLMGTQGRERTLSEWQSLFAGSGFSLVEMINSRSFAKLLLLRRN